MFIHRASAFLTDRIEDPQTLKGELRHYSEIHFRRVNKFIMLTLVGVHQCVARQAISPETAVYVTTERGNLGDTETVLHQIFRRQSLPMPYNFINTMTNTASFYVAQSLSLTSRNMTVSSQNLSFERGMELLGADFGRQTVTSALIGGVDEFNPSDVHFERKFGIPYGTVRQKEGSCWLHVTDQRGGAIGAFLGVQSCRSIGDVEAWFRNRSAGPPAVLAFGLAVGPEERKACREAARFDEEFDYIGQYGYFDSATACGASRFLTGFPGRQLLHVNRDLSGRYTILILESYG